MFVNLAEYFAKNPGVGILATADAQGRVDLAVYETPEVIDDKTISLNMLDRLSYQNLKSNPNAAYMFLEASGNWNGKRLYLKKIAEMPGIERVRELKKNNLPLPDPALTSKFHVRFTVERIRPAVGDEN